MLQRTLSRSVELFADRALVLFGIAVVVYLPADLVFAAVDDTRGWGDVSFERLLIGFAVSYVAGFYAFGACVAVLGDQKLGVSGALAVTLRRFATLIVVALVVTAGILLGLLALIVPGILLLVWWWVSFQAVVLEGLGWRRALGRSRELARGHFGPIFLVALGTCGGYVFVDYVLVWVVGRSLLPDFWSAWLVGSLADVLAAAFSAAVTTALYLELRAGRSA